MNTSITLSEYMREPAVLERFENILGKDAEGYVQSVLIAVSASSELQKCTNESIFRSSLRAASLQLSCDPALKQAHLVPYNRNVGTRDNPQWIKEAQFQPHYKGLYTLAMRTGKYWQINVSPVYQGQRVLENPLTGLHLVQEPNGFVGEHPGKYSGYNDVTNRRRKNEKVIGWLGYFKTKKGFEKSVWMSSEDIDDHARKYVKDYEKNPNWSDPEKRPTMEMKTVLRQLLSWADLSGSENSQLAEALKDDEPIEVHAEEVTPVQQSMTYDHARQVTIKIGKSEKFIGEIATAEKLNELYLAESTNDEQREAIRVVLQQDFQMQPPQPQGEKRSKEQNLKELGF